MAALPRWPKGYHRHLLLAPYTRSARRKTREFRNQGYCGLTTHAREDDPLLSRMIFMRKGLKHCRRLSKQPCSIEWRLVRIPMVYLGERLRVAEREQTGDRRTIRLATAQLAFHCSKERRGFYFGGYLLNSIQLPRLLLSCLSSFFSTLSSRSGSLILLSGP